MENQTHLWERKGTCGSTESDIDVSQTESVDLEQMLPPSSTRGTVNECSCHRLPHAAHNSEAAAL